MPNVVGFLRWRIIDFTRRWAWPFFTTLEYDNISRRRSLWTTGSAPPGEKVAIYLIYPQFGLQPSHERSIAYLAGRGFSVTAVSNLPLSEVDLQRLLPITSMVLQLPNIGYDFGGYRDGVLQLFSRRNEIRQLVLANDSVWFPLPGGLDWLDNVDDMDLDFVGAASNLALRTVDPAHLDGFSWVFDDGNPEFHYCSYALSFGQRVLTDDDFWHFWKRFRITNNKMETVRRGEVGLSQWVLGRGYTHGSTLPVSSIEQEVKALPDERILELLSSVIVPQEQSLRDAIDEYIRERPEIGWRPTAEKVLLNAIARTGVSYVLPEFFNRELGFPFLKKSPLFLDRAGMEHTLRFLDRLPDPVGSELVAEARQMTARR